MQKFTAHDAKAQFGNLIDTARREPVYGELVCIKGKRSLSQSCS